MNEALLVWMMTTPETPEPPECALLAELVNRPAWHAEAACRGVDPALFFPEKRGEHRPVQALAYCAECPVTAPCLASALELASTVGVWGNTTGLERRGLRHEAGGVPARRGVAAVRARRRRKDEREAELRWAEGELIDDEDELAHSADWWA